MNPSQAVFKGKFTAPTTTIRPSTRRSTVCQAQFGDKLLPLIRTPFDLLALGPRIALGSVNSLNETLAQLPADVEKIAAFVADPRPLPEKQSELLEELEARVVNYVEKGTAIEVDIINSIPEPVKDALPAQLKEIILAPRPMGTAEDYAADTSYVSTWTMSSMDEADARFPSTAMNGGRGDNGVDDDDYVMVPEIPGSAVAANQVAAELVEIQTAVVVVRDALTALKTNTEPSKEAMLRLNLREASQSLSGRLEQLRPGDRASDAAVEAAVVEAEALFMDVQALI